MKKIIKIIKNPLIIVLKLANLRLIKLSDKKFISLEYKVKFGKKPNLKEPKTFNEKIQWIKLNKRNPKYTRMVDKITAKEYVKEVLGTDENIVKNYGTYDSFKEIDFNSLPNKFVIKCNHDSGGLVVVNDKSKLDLNKAEKKINKSLKRNFYYTCREWIYKNIKPRILVEEYLENEEEHDLIDYKFFCFDGIPKFIYVSKGLSNHSTATIDFYDMDFKKLPFGRKDYRHEEKEMAKPKNFEEMIRIAKELSKGVDFVRVDLYNIAGKVYFSELTFTPSAGYMPFDPEEYDLKIGEMLNLTND